MAKFYKATKEGWDGNRIRKPGEVFPFDGKRGSWMVPCDESGTVAEGEKIPPQERPMRLGAKTNAGGTTRNELREQLKAAGIPFKATDGAPQLAELLKANHAKEQPGPQERGGTGDQDVI